MKLLPHPIAYCIALTLLVALPACDNGLTDMNVDPTAATELEPGPRFTAVQLQTSEDRFEAWRGNLIHAASMIQHLSSTFTAYSGDRYTLNREYVEAFWEAMYANPVQGIQDLIYDLESLEGEEAEEHANMLAAARVMRVFIFHRLTDLHGDIPYHEAGLGFIEGIGAPEYDSQEEIYPHMIDELQEAVASFEDGLETFGSNDLFFAGDVEQWRRFGNAMMLRLGMRMSEVDPEAAESAVRAAIDGGVLESNDDLVYIEHETGPDDINEYGVGRVFHDFGVGGHGFAMSDTFMDILLDAENDGANVDPRANVFAAVYDADENLVSDDPEDLEGLPNGLDGSALGNLDVYEFAQPHRDIMVRRDSPNLFMSYAEVEFLLAEAALRGWGAPESAQAHYENGIRAAMEHLTIYSDEAAISDEDIQAYIEAAPEASLETVATQKWIALFLNGYEAYAEWRRTGYPELEPVNYSGNETGGTIPRRLIYPTGEQSNNQSNYEEAVSRQGPDEFTTRVWWDVEE